MTSSIKILHNLSINPFIDKDTQKTLLELENVTTHLFQRLDDQSIKNHEILSEICQITSRWRTLIRENNPAMGKPLNRLRLFHAYENIMDRVKLAVLQKKRQQSNNPQEGLVHRTIHQLIETGATAARISVDLFNKAATILPASSYQEWIQNTRDHFIDYADQILVNKGKEVDFDQILEGIDNWQKFVKEAHTKGETDVRISHLKKTVMQEINTTDSDSSTEEREEFENYLEEVNRQPQFLREKANSLGISPEEILAGSPLFFSQEEERSLYEQGRDVFTNAITIGKDSLFAASESVQSTVVASLEMVTNRGAQFQKETLQWVDKSVEEIEQEVSQIVEFIQSQTQQAIEGIKKKMFEGGYCLQDQGIHAISMIVEKAKETIQFVTSEAARAHQALVNKKNSYLAEQLKPFTPKELLNDPTKQNFLRKWEQETNKITPLLTDINKNLQRNVLLLLNPTHLKRMGAITIQALGNGLNALQKSQNFDEMKKFLIDNETENHSSQKILKHLHQAKDIKDYQKIVEKSICKKLGYIAGNRELDKGLNQYLKNKWEIIKAKTCGIVIYLAMRQQKIFPNLLNTLKSNENLETLLKMSGTEIKIGMTKRDIMIQILRFKQESDLLFYYIMDKVTNELIEILKGKSASPILQSENSLKTIRDCTFFCVNGFNHASKPNLSP